MATALEHRKFSRKVSEEPEHPYLDPLPDHTEEIPRSLIKAPEGRVESTTTTTIQGADIEHFYSQQNAANANLLENVAKKYRGVAKLYDEMLKDVVKKRGGVFELNSTTMESMIEYVGGVKFPKHLAEPLRDDLIEGCGLKVTGAEVDALLADSRSSPAALPTMNALLQSLYKESSGAGPTDIRSPTSPLTPPFANLSLTEKAELEERLAEVTQAPATVQLLSDGVHLRDTDPLAYVKSELRETANTVPDLRQDANTHRMARDTAFGDASRDRGAEGIEQHAMMTEKLRSAASVCYDRMQAIEFSQGEMAEYKIDAEAWTEKAVVAVEPQIESFKALRINLQADLIAIQEKKGEAVSKGFDRTAKFTERKLKLLRDIKRSTQRQDQAVAAVEAAVAKCTSIHEERVRNITQLMEEVDTETRGAVELECVIGQYEKLSDHYTEAIAAANRVQTLYQTIHTETVLGMAATLETNCNFSEMVEALKGEEPRHLYDVFQEFAIETGDLIAEREEELFSVDKALRHLETLPAAKRSAHFNRNQEQHLDRRDRILSALDGLNASFVVLEDWYTKCEDIAKRVNVAMSSSNPFKDSRARIAETKVRLIKEYAEKEEAMAGETQCEMSTTFRQEDDEYDKMAFGYDPTNQSRITEG